MGNESIAIIVLIIAAIIGLAAIIKALGLAKQGVNVSIEKSKTAISTINQQLESKRQHALEIKIKNIVADELVRELVRKAIREGIDPDTYQLCNDCLGKGCTRCNSSGWLKTK